MAASFSAVQASAQYIYDDLGRLAQAIGSNGDTVQYQYDANGNVVSINRINASDLSISNVTPLVAHAGTVVVVSGTGFSSILSENAVTIGGFPVSVSSSTLTTLSFTVPLGAIGGPVSVTNTGGTVTSSQHLTVLKPAVSSFTPSMVNPGGLVTLTGANLNLVPGSTTVTVGGASASLSSISNGTIVFAAPTIVGSSTITVSTSYGGAQSAGSLTVVPSTVNAANVSSYGSIAEGAAAQSVSLSASNKYSLLEFVAAAGEWYTLQVSSLAAVPSGGSISYTIYSPTSAVFASGTMTAANTSIHLPVIAAAGKYLISFGSGATTSVQLQAQLRLNQTLSANGMPQAVSTAINGQSLRYVFSGTAGQDLGLAISGLTSSASYATVYVYKPDGSTLTYVTYCYVSNGGCQFQLRNLPATGTYKTVVSPAGQVTMSFSVTLSSPVTSSLPMGSPIGVNFAPGQYALLNLTTTAGQTVGVNISSMATTPSGKSLQVSVYNSSGAQMWSTVTFSSSNYTVNLPNMAAGIYTILIASQYANITASTMQVKLVPGLTGTLLADGSSSSVVSTVPGQTGYFTFSGTVGQNLGLAISNLTTSASYVTAYVYKPDSSTLAYTTYCYVSNGGCQFQLQNLPITGTYSVTVYPAGQVTMSFNLTLSQPVIGTLSVGGSQSVNLVPGQYTLLAFTVTAGQTVGVNISSMATTPAGKTMYAYVYNSAGGQVSYVSFTSSSYTINLNNLAAGTYTVLIVPQYANVTAVAMQVSLVTGITGTLLSDGSSTGVASTVAGQAAYYTFSGTAGQDLGLAVSALSTSASYATVYVYKPDGSTLAYVTYCYVSNGGCQFQLRNLPTTGNYKVVIAPAGQVTMSFNLTLSQPVTGMLTAGGSQAVNLVPGQYTLLTFAATAGQSAAINVTAMATSPTGRTMLMYVYNPSGTQVSSVSFSSASKSVNLTGMVVGSYTILLVPQYANITAAVMQIGVQ